ncbi:hypothetical protein C8R44DRAFT_238047 [Mycena epipterygia]|nr:hypothetical protein C8R44DRAFT_238047 [Mycena epipterygia]
MGIFSILLILPGNIPHRVASRTHGLSLPSAVPRLRGYLRLAARFPWLRWIPPICAGLSDTIAASCRRRSCARLFYFFRRRRRRLFVLRTLLFSLLTIRSSVFLLSYLSLVFPPSLAPHLPSFFLLFLVFFPHCNADPIFLFYRAHTPPHASSRATPHLPRNINPPIDPTRRTRHTHPKHPTLRTKHPTRPTPPRTQTTPKCAQTQSSCGGTRRPPCRGRHGRGSTMGRTCSAMGRRRPRRLRAGAPLCPCRLRAGAPLCPCRLRAGAQRCLRRLSGRLRGRILCPEAGMGTGTGAYSTNLRRRPGRSRTSTPPRTRACARGRSRSCGAGRARTRT